MPKPIYTISQVIAVPENDWVNAEIFATLTNPKAPSGKGPWSATLSDQTGSIVGKFWGGSIDHWAGKRIKISGVGLQRKEYKGTPELSVSQKADVSFAGAPGAVGQAVDSNPDLEAAPPAPQRSYSPPPSSSSPSRQNAPTASGTPVHGATVGGALARAVDIYLAHEKGVWGPKSVEHVERITRDLVAIQQRVESGAPASPREQEVSSEDVPF